MFQIPKNRLKIIQTVVLYIGAITSGMAMAVVGPTLIDLQNMVKTDTKHIAFVYTARSSGYLFGSLFGGVLFDMTSSKQLVLAMIYLVSGASMIAVPWSRKLGVLTPWVVLNGVAQGAIDTGINVCILLLWGKDSGPYYQPLHFNYGLGSLIASLIAVPFLDTFHSSSSPIFNTTSLNLTLNLTTLLSTRYIKKPHLSVSASVPAITTSEYTSFIPYPPRVSFIKTSTMSYNSTSTIQNISLPAPSSIATSSIPSITYVYSIIALILLVVSGLFLLTCFVAPFDGGPKGTDAKTLPRSKVFVVGIVFLNFMLLFIDMGTEIGYAQMLTTYAVKGPLKLSSTTGSYMTSSFWGAFTLGRFASIFLAMRFSSMSLLVGDIVVTAAGAAFLYLLAPTHEWALWVATLLLGAGIASFFPSAVAWVERYINVTNKIVAIFAIGAAFGEMIIPFTISSYIEEVPEVVSYVVIATFVLSALLTFVMYSIFRRTQEKYVTKKEGGQENIAVATIT